VEDASHQEQSFCLLVALEPEILERQQEVQTVKDIAHKRQESVRHAKSLEIFALDSDVLHNSVAEIVLQRLQSCIFDVAHFDVLNDFIRLGQSFNQDEKTANASECVGQKEPVVAHLAWLNAEKQKETDLETPLIECGPNENFLELHNNLFSLD